MAAEAAATVVAPPLGSVAAAAAVPWLRVGASETCDRIVIDMGKKLRILKRDASSAISSVCRMLIVVVEARAPRASHHPLPFHRRRAGYGTEVTLAIAPPANPSALTRQFPKHPRELGPK